MPWNIKIPDLKNNPLYLEPRVTGVESQLAENETKVSNVKRNFIKPQYIEYYGSFSRFGLGVPSGIANHSGGNYVLIVTGNVGDSFVTVENGNIGDAGTTTKWACVIENNDGLLEVNQVTGTDGISKVNLLEPLTKSITSKRLGNLHDANLGQHYTELGYFAFIQHLYNMNPRHTERNNYIAKFKPDDTSGAWTISSLYSAYNISLNMENATSYYQKIGSKHLELQVNSTAHYAEWTVKLDGQKGYLEMYLGLDRGTAMIEFYGDNVLIETKTIRLTGNRVLFDYENITTGKVKIIGNGPYDNGNGRQRLFIGLTTWWINEKFQEERVVNPNDKVVYIGDSWGEYHNKATTRELTRLMQNDEGSPTVLDYSKAGHTSTYARVWFDEYVISNKPDKVIIEYFTNDFNSIGGTSIGTFLNPDGVQQDMSIASITEFANNIAYMVDKAIKSGIQPIIIMPASTNSGTQSQNAANFSIQLWLGDSVINENPIFKNVSSEITKTPIVESKDGGSVGQGTLKFSSKEITSSARKGVMSDTNTGSAITNGDIHGFYNNGTRKAGVKHNGAMDTPFLQLQVQSSNIGASSINRAILYIHDDGVNDDTLKIVIEKADGTYAIKKIQLID